jgi:peptide/nickel transport system permease protein
VLLGVVILVFLLFQALPGDSAQLTMGQRSDVESLNAVRKDLGLDKPKYQQLLLYLNDVSPLSINANDKQARTKYHFVTLIPFSQKINLVLKIPYLRTSYQDKRSVVILLMEALPNTAVLALTALILAAVVGVLLGIFIAVFKGTWVDRTVLISTTLGISAPSFFVAIIFQWLFAFVLGRYTGLHLTGSLYAINNFTGQPVLMLSNLIIPALTLGIRPIAIIAQLTRNSMLDVLSQDYMRTATAKGLSRFSVVMKHGLRNALNPVVTTISGWLAELLAGSFFVESIMGWNGIGKLTVDALEKNDFPVVMGAVLFTAAIFILINILTDILYGVLDKRISLSSKT